jgi:hypothetical protein
MQEEAMIFGSRLTAATAAFMFMISPALAQTTPAPSAPAQPPSAQPDINSDSMREMMREMMQEMMRQGPRADGRKDRAERRGGDRWPHRAQRDRPRHHGGYARGTGGMRSGMMHLAGMRMMFAIIDADGDGALSLSEVQEFHARIFHAIDENGDGGVEMHEIGTFFHPSIGDAAE